jgi:GT2 family glycosyltransferase
VHVDIVVVDNGSDRAYEMVRDQYPQVRALRTENRGFGHANNTGLLAGIGRYALFLNPDTQILQGDLDALVAELDRRQEIGLVGVRQVTADGTLWPTIRYFPGVRRALGDALAAERWPSRPRWLGERELDMARYERLTECDWTSGSFMLVRRDSVLAAGLFDERFFLYSEEPDLCLRIKRAGWSVCHLPSMTILHHAGKQGLQPRMTAQESFSRRQYAAKHFPAGQRVAYLAALATGHALRAGIAAQRGERDRAVASRLALRTLTGLAPPPFGQPMETALASTDRRLQ